VRILRTSGDRFAVLPSFPYESRYAEVPAPDGGTWPMAYIDEGAGPAVLSPRGEPSWSFLYRYVIRVLLDAGPRVVAPDLIGFGRSDKPAESADHSYARHIAWTRALQEDAGERLGGEIVSFVRSTE
jgi:haloalkane dehalogenase